MHLGGTIPVEFKFEMTGTFGRVSLSIERIVLALGQLPVPIH